jgi:hypothetical protein
MDKRYNVYYAGQLLQGQHPDVVRARLGKLFNADQQTLERLFSGKAQLLKRECDRATALKYKQAMERAGALPLIRVSEDTSAVQAPPSVAPGAMTTAETNATMAVAAETGEHDSAGAGAWRGAPPAAGEMRLAPPGAELLLESERHHPVQREIDTSGLDLGATGDRLSPRQPPPPPAPETGHLTIAAAGEEIPNLPAGQPPQPPDVSALDLTPPGTDFSDCTAPEPTPPALDLSGLDFAPAGSDLLEAQYRRRPQEQWPDTDHLSLQE